MKSLMFYEKNDEEHGRTAESRQEPARKEICRSDHEKEKQWKN